jgi:casein kinase II subunit beta
LNGSLITLYIFFQNLNVTKDSPVTHSLSDTLARYAPISYFDLIGGIEIGRPMDARSWVVSFLARPSSVFFVTVPDPFLTDFVSRVPPSDLIPDPESAARLLLAGDASLRVPELDAQAQTLFGLAHRAFLASERGTDAIFAKWLHKSFRPCPRTFCRKTQCLPCGLTDDLVPNSLKLLCPACREIYNFREPGFEAVFGAFFGRDYADTLLRLHPEMGEGASPEVYLPRVYGFRVLERPDQPDEDPLEL